jgi:hypothetical protein
VKGSYVRSTAHRWLVGSALLWFTVSGYAGAATTPAISGKVTATLPSGTMLSDLKAVVVATNDKNEVFTANPDDSTGAYSISPVNNGTYKVVSVVAGMAAPAVTNLVISDASPTATENFAMVAPAPFPIVKSPNPIPLTDGIDSASFQDAPEIDLVSGENVAVGDRTMWGGPNTVSGRFKFKYSTQAIHIAADVTYKTPRVNDQTGGNIWNANALEIDIQNDKYDPTRTAYDPDHNWQFAVALGNAAQWYLFGGVQAAPMINGAAEPVASHFMIQDKTPNTGETFRVDIPWAILLDSSGKAISPPADNALGAIDIALDAADPTQPLGTSTADNPVTRAFQLTWSGLADTWTNPIELVQVQFAPQAPASLGQIGGTGDVKAPGSSATGSKP